MRTPDVLHSIGHRSLPDVRCENPQCNHSFSPRVGKKYCFASCRSAHTEVSRQTLVRLKKLYPLAEPLDVPLGLIGPSVLENGSRAMQGRIWRELFEINQLLFEDGPVDGGVATRLRHRALRLLAVFNKTPPSDAVEELQFAQFMELLRDIGTRHRHGVRAIIKYAWAAVMNVTEEIEQPYARLETAREIVGYWSTLDQTRAVETLGTLHSLLSVTPNLPKYGALTLLRPDIECLLAAGRSNDKEYAIELIRTTYLDTFVKDPHLHYYYQLEKWNRLFKLGIESKIRTQQYVSPILIWMRRKAVA